MRAIIIEEDRFAEVCELMKHRATEISIDAGLAGRLGCDIRVLRAATSEIQRMMHCEFVRWAQSHGASCVKK